MLVADSKASKKEKKEEKVEQPAPKVEDKKTEEPKAEKDEGKKEVPDWYKEAQEKVGKKAVDEEKVEEPEEKQPKEDLEEKAEAKTKEEQAAEDYEHNIDAFAKTADISTDDKEASDVKKVEGHTKKTLTKDVEGQRAPLDTSATDAKGAAKEMLTLLPTIEVDNNDNPELSGAVKELKEKKDEKREKLKSVLPSNSGIIAQKEEIIVEDSQGLEAVDIEAVVEKKDQEEAAAKSSEKLDDAAVEKPEIKEEANEEVKEELKEESKEESKAKAKMVAAEVIAAEDSGKAGMTGTFSPVGSKLVKEQDSEKLEELVVEDADDSELQEGFTDSGAYAGPDYVEMPKSRVKKFFGRFRKEKDGEQESMTEVLQVSEDFNATEVGKERGSWESFKEEVEANVVEDKDDSFEPVDDGEEFQTISIKPASNKDDFEGGAFSKLKLDKVSGLKDKVIKKDKQEVEIVEEEIVDEYEDLPIGEEFEPLSTSETGELPIAKASEIANMDDEEIIAQAQSEASPVDHGAELEESIVKKFRSGTIDKEVWFVALGAETRSAEGMKHFLDAHKKELRGAVYIQVDALGAGEFAYVEKDGYINNVSISSRLQRFAEKTARRIGIPIKKVKLNYAESASSVVQKEHLQAIRLVGELNSKPAYFSKENDTIDNIDPELLEERAAFVLEMIRSI